MLVALQLVGVARDPLNVTVLVPCDDPKFVPVIVTGVPTGPEVGLRFVMFGPEADVTVKNTPLLTAPATVTTTFPGVAPAGTGVIMLVALQLVGVASVPLNVTVLVPCDDPKFVPVIVTEVPTGPEAGFKLVMVGPEADVTVKNTALLATPFTVTTTFPDVAPAGTGAIMLVALQLVGVASVPLNLTVLVPCDDPKFVPLMVTEVATGPEAGFRLVMVGPEADVTVKNTPLLAAPATVTTTFPDVAPAGTGAVMLAALQFVGVESVPLNVTVLVPCDDPKFVPVIVTEVPTGPDVGFRLVTLSEFPLGTPPL